MKKLLLCVFALCIVGAGCSKVKPTTKKDLLPVVFETQKEIDVKEAIIALRRVHFKYDSSQLTTASRVALADAATKLWRYDDIDLVVEGHADTRGTDEYNIALGERRSRAAAKYLNRMGMKNTQMTRISFGAEMPLAEGEDELAHALNRRVDFKILQGNVMLMVVDGRLVSLPIQRTHASLD